MYCLSCFETSWVVRWCNVYHVSRCHRLLHDVLFIAGDNSLYASARTECMCKLSMQTFELFGQHYHFESDVQPIVMDSTSEGSQMFGISPFFIKTGTILQISKFVYFLISVHSTNKQTVWQRLLFRSIPLKIRGSVWESCIRSVMFCGAETRVLTGKLEEILKSFHRRMSRYMARVRGQDRISSEEVGKRCGLKMIQDKLKKKRLK